MAKPCRPTVLRPATSWRLFLIAALALALLCGSCSTPPKVRFTQLRYWEGKLLPCYGYTVRRGDTLAAIADRFGCDLSFLARFNGTAPNRTLGASERILIPRTGTQFPPSYYAKPRRSELARSETSSRAQSPKADLGPPPGTYSSASGSREQAPQRTALAARPTPRAIRTTPTPSPSVSQPKSATAIPPSVAAGPPPRAVSDRQKGIQIAQAYNKRRLSLSSQATVPNAPPFQWPADGKVSSLFNVRSSGRRLHNGIDIANKRGTPIRAALGGRVIYSDNKYLPSMGNMILIEHSSGWITLYSHNERNLVKEGDAVAAGQTIATVGMTGNATGPHVHFEIRKNAETPVDPLRYLPPRR